MGGGGEVAGGEEGERGVAGSGGGATGRRDGGSGPGGGGGWAGVVAATQAAGEATRSRTRARVGATRLAREEVEAQQQWEHAKEAVLAAEAKRGEVEVKGVGDREEIARMLGREGEESPPQQVLEMWREVAAARRGAAEAGAAEGRARGLVRMLERAIAVAGDGERVRYEERLRAAQEEVRVAGDRVCQEKERGERVGEEEEEAGRMLRQWGQQVKAGRKERGLWERVLKTVGEAQDEVDGQVQIAREEERRAAVAREVAAKRLERGVGMEMAALRGVAGAVAVAAEAGAEAETANEAL